MTDVIMIQTTYESIFERKVSDALKNGYELQDTHVEHGDKDFLFCAILVSEE